MYSRSVTARRSLAALARAIALVGKVGREVAAAALAIAGHRRHAVLTPAVGVQRGRTVRTNDSEICETVVRGHPIDVIKDERHPGPSPELTLAAHLAFPLLHSFGEQALL